MVFLLPGTQSGIIAAHQHSTAKGIYRMAWKALWLVLVVSLVVCLSAQHVRAQNTVVRLAVVNTPEEGGLLRDILPEFERQTGLRVQVYSGEDLYDRARRGEADLTISHYGHPGVEPFMNDGLGLWPRFVFANQHVIIGPSSDPARIANLTDAVEGFRRIAQSRSPFVANNGGVPKYLEDLLWEAAGRPSKQGWYVDMGLREQRAAEAAAQRGAYTIWGLVPFLQYREQAMVDLRPLLVNDALLSRHMVSVVMKPERFPQANIDGAKALEKYLLAPSTQARIKAVRYPGLDHALWWPAARENSPISLGYGGDPMQQGPPVINAGAIVNAADRRGAIAPGAIVEIYGTALAIGTCIADAAPPWPTQLGCSPTRVSIGGRDAPVLFVSPTQVNAQIPSDSPAGSVNVVVIRGMAQSNVVPVTLRP